MSERKYYYHHPYNSSLGKIVRPVTKEETVQKKSLFGKVRYEKVTRTEKMNVPLPLLMYLEDGKYYEFFTGKELKNTFGESFWFVSDVIPDEARRGKYHDFSCCFRYTGKNTETLNATQFAKIVEDWLPYKEEYEKRITKRIKEVEQQYLEDDARQKEEQARALSAEEKSEAWLDSMIRKGKF